MNDPATYWYVYKGASFDLWSPDTGVYYASVDAHKITEHLQQKRRRGHKNRGRRSASSPSRGSTTQTPPLSPPTHRVRDIARSTDTRTVIAALIPGRVVTTHKAPYLLWPRGAPRDEAFTLGVLSSMILDWYARCVVELNMTFHILNNFPIPDADVDNDPVAARVVEIAGRLAAVDDRYDDWATEVGVPVGSVADDATKYDLVCELDACVAILYDLDESDLAVVYETFHKRADYSERHEAVLGHFRRWQRQS